MLGFPKRVVCKVQVDFRKRVVGTNCHVGSCRLVRLNTIRYTVVWGQPTSQSALLFTRSWPGATSHGQLVNDRGSGIQGFSTVEFASQNLIPGKCAPDRATQSETGANKVNLRVACLLPFTQCGPPRTRSFSRSS